ncbi:MAG: hypothetical protein GX616_24845, partial [Planctomycetes bacterium]|nr:hypothetical protein [Planctomycetota bacterium]
MTECDNDAFGPQVPVTCYAYDEGGRQNTVWNPDGTVTTTEYDGLGRVLLVTENDGGDLIDLDGVRRTAHSYDQYGRLELMAAVDTMNNSGTVSSYASIDWEATDGTIQITRFEYGADVLDKSGAKISEHNGWIKAVHYPDPDTGQPSTSPSLSFEYYSDGSVASREDEKGNRFVYHYDEQGRLVQTDVTGSRWYASGANERYDPPPPIKTITYSYTPDGLPETVTAYDGENATGNILSQSTFDYDTLRHLTKESQSHGGAVTTGTPAISYAWDMSPGDSTFSGYDRLVGMTYPTRPETGARSLGFSYVSETGDIDSRL